MFKKKKSSVVKKIILLVLVVTAVFIFSASGNSDKVNIPKDKPVSDVTIDEPEKLPETEVEPEEVKNIKLMFVGDVMMDSYFADYINSNGVDYSWTSVSHITNEADLTIANLETSVSDRGLTTKPEGYGFRSAPFALEGLANAGIDMVNLANNHVLDYGQTAFLDTMDNLEKFDIQYVGAGKDSTEVYGLKIMEQQGLKVGFLSFSDVIPATSWIAGENKPGISTMATIKEDQKLITEAKEKCDILIVMLHWGIEHQDTPTEQQVELAHKIVDSGADAIVGHHAHVLQGIEIYNEKPIVYNTGNFVFLKKDDEAGKTAVFELNFNNDSFDSGQIHPVFIDKCVANLLPNEDPKKEEILLKMSKISSDLSTKVNTDGTF